MISSISHYPYVDAVRYFATPPNTSELRDTWAVLPTTPRPACASFEMRYVRKDISEGMMSRYSWRLEVALTNCSPRTTSPTFYVKIRAITQNLARLPFCEN